MSNLRASQERCQRLLNISVAHVRKQGCKSMGSQSSCQYKAGELGCAAAPFIKEYDPRMDSRSLSWPHLIQEERDYPGFEQRFDADAVEETDFVRVLQCPHDFAGPGAQFLAEYEQLLANEISGWNRTTGMMLRIPPA